MEKVLLKTSYPELDKPRRGKVRDIYDLGNFLWMIATDRVSAFDSILPNGIPGKGRVLNQISLAWFRLMEDLIPNHVVASDVNERSVLVRKASPLDAEFIVRGYLSGSGWKEYQENGTVCGIKLPAGLKESQKIPRGPIFTPSTKAKEGHDVNITFKEMKKIVRHPLDTRFAHKVRDICLAMYSRARKHAKKRGIIIADTKFELGTYDGELILIDEVLTPDSSRFWDMKKYEPGKSQDSYDKQPIRDYLKSIGWKGIESGPAPKLPKWLIAETSQRYQKILEILTK